MDFEAIYLFYRLLHLMLSLVVIGEPLRVIFSKYTGLFGKLDFLQICVINVYLAGLVLYTVAMIPLHLFSASAMWGILAVCGSLSVLLHLSTLKELLLRLKTASGTMVMHKEAVLKSVLVSLMFLSMLWMEVVPLSNFIYGNIHDSALFGLFVKLNLRNQQTPVTMQPYGTEGIIYPQGFFVVEAFACHLSGFSAAEVTLRITPLFMALSVLGAYYLGKTLSPKSHLDISLAFTFWCISRWPRLLLWGSNAFVAGFPLYFVCLSLLPQLKNLQRQERGKTKILAIGILFGYLAAVHLVFFELLFALVVLMTLFSILREHSQILLRLKNFLVFCVFSIIPISVSVQRFILWYPYPGNNIGLPSDVVLRSEEWTGGVPIAATLEKIRDWAIVSDWISPHPLIRNMIIGLVVVGTVVTILLRKDKLFTHMKEIILIAVSSVAVAGLIVILTTKEATIIFPFISSWAVLLVQMAEITILAHTSFHIIIGISNIMLFHGIQKLCLSASRWRNHKTGEKSYNVSLRGARFKGEKRAIFGVVLFSVLIFAAVWAPFICYTFVLDQEYINEQYKLFCVTTEDDNQLMLWMENGIPKNSIILINPYDAGGFIPIVSDHRVVYQPGASRYSSSYDKLVDLIGDCCLNTTAYGLMQELNISHVFVGSSALFGHYPWDPMLFLGNPNFKLLKNVGEAYLFEANVEDPELNSVFTDNFERGDLATNGWVVTTSQNEGFGYANITSEQSFDGMASVKVASKSLGKGFWYSIQRKVYVPSMNSVSLSFYVDVANGFGLIDSFMIVVSDSSWTRQLFFVATPDGTNASVIVLPAVQGYFQFDMSELWQEVYSSALPTSFYLQVLSFDSDGIENVAYVDLIRIEIQM